MSKKSLLMALCLVLAFMTAAAGTVAFLTDSETVTNTFTMGKVEIDLDETKVDAAGEPVEGADRVQGNEYHLIPGKSYTKDPTVTVKANSEESYLRMILTVTEMETLKTIFGDAGFDTAVWFDGTLSADWTLHAGPTEDEENDAFVWEFRYKEPVSTAGEDDDLTLAPLFTTLKVPGTVTGDELALLKDMQIIVEAHAIQVESFDDDVDDAWAAFDQQNTPAPGDEEESGDETEGQ